jgi:type IV pilus assembly protein PilW
LSLVELMVAITLGLLLTAAVIQVFVSSRGVFRMQDSMSRLQENGRFAIDFLAQDIRMAGFIGCPSIDRIGGTGSFSHNTLITSFTADTVIASVSNATVIGGIDVAPDTDTLTIRKASANSVRLADATSGNTVQLLGESSAIDIATDEILLVSDCLTADVIKVSAITSGTNPTITAHASLAKSYGTDAEVLRYQPVAYFVGDTSRETAAGEPIYALYVDRGAGPVELVEGVESMRIELGEDTAGADRSADTYREVDDVVNWDRVVSVRINLLLHSVEDNVASGGQAQSLTFMGDPVTSDGRLRQVFSSTVAIRNRLP